MEDASVTLQCLGASKLSANGGKIHSFFKQEHSAAPHRSEHVAKSMLGENYRKKVKLKLRGKEQVIPIKIT